MTSDEALEELLAARGGLGLVARGDEVVVELLQRDLAVEDVLCGRVGPAGVPLVAATVEFALVDDRLGDEQ